MKHIFTTRISTHFLPPIVNDDYTGLEDEEGKKLDDWLGSLPEGAVVVPAGEETQELSFCEVTGLISETQEVCIYLPE